MYTTILVMLYMFNYFVAIQCDNSHLGVALGWSKLCFVLVPSNTLTAP